MEEEVLDFEASGEVEVYEFTRAPYVGVPDRKTRTEKSYIDKQYTSVTAVEMPSEEYPTTTKQQSMAPPLIIVDLDGGNNPVTRPPLRKGIPVSRVTLASLNHYSPLLTPEVCT